MYNKKLNVSGIYVITNDVNGKQYVGASKNIEKRWSDHRSKSIHPRKKDEFDSKFYKAIREYGLEHFDIEVLEQCSETEMFDREIYWVKKLNTFQNGYNNDYGGYKVCETHIHRGEDHGRAALTKQEVIGCRKLYAQGESSREVYEKSYKDKITYSGFQRMWHGKSWKDVMPEVFQNNPRPKKKATDDDIRTIRQRFDNGEGCYSISKDYKGKLAYATVYDIAHRNRFKDVN